MFTTKPIKNLSSRLRAECHENGLTQKELGKLMGLEHYHTYQVHRDENKFTIEEIQIMAWYLKCQPYELLLGIPPKKYKGVRK